MENIKKKICFLVTQSEMGGAQRYIYEVTKVLAHEHEILVAAGQGDGEFFQKLKNVGVQPVYLKRIKRVPWPGEIILAIKEIFDFLKKERPDILFLCSTTAGLLGSVASKIYKLETKNYKLKTIYRIGGWAFRDPRPIFLNWIILWAEKLTARFKDLIVVNSEYDRKIAIKKKIVSPQKIIKIYNGLDGNSLYFLPKGEAQNYLFSNIGTLERRNIKLLGCVANFYKTKGLEFLISSMTRPDLCRSSNLQLLIIGDGRLRAKLVSQIKKLEIKDKVILAGRISDAQKYLKAFDIFVLPSLKEGFPWIILEAMAAELPIVATNVGALPEIIEDGKEGFLVPPKNSQALAEKIKWLLEHPQKAKAMGRQAKAKLVKEFSCQKMIKETQRIL